MLFVMLHGCGGSPVSTTGDLDDRVDALEVLPADINDLSETLAALQASIGALDAQLAAVDTRLAAVEASVGALEDATLDDRLIATEEGIVSLESALDGAATAAGEAALRLDAVELGLSSVQTAQATTDLWVSSLETESVAFDTRLTSVETASAASVLLEDADIPVASCDELLAELDRLQTIRFGPGVTVTLTVAPGVHLCPDSVRVSHPQGKQLTIVGDTSAPLAVELRFPGEGITVMDGGALGLIDGLRLAAITPGVGSGIVARMGGNIDVGAHVWIEDFGQGIEATTGGIIRSAGDATSHLVINRGSYGLLAQRGGFINADWAEILDVTDIGMYALTGGIIDAGYNIIEADSSGAVARSNGSIFANASSSTTPGLVGVQADRGGYISWDSGSSTSSGYAYQAYVGGIVDANNTTGTVWPGATTDIYALPSTVYQQ
jgi:hypothetical protein